MSSSRNAALLHLCVKGFTKDRKVCTKLPRADASIGPSLLLFLLQPQLASRGHPFRSAISCRPSVTYSLQYWRGLNDREGPTATSSILQLDQSTKLGGQQSVTISRKTVVPSSTALALRNHKRCNASLGTNVMTLKLQANSLASTR